MSSGTCTVNVDGCYANGPGPLVGSAGTNSSMTLNITNCYTTGDINDGGIVGSTFSSDATTNITNCYTTGDITSPTAGGIIGHTTSDTNITNCYSAGAISNSGHGIVGRAYGTVDIDNCYSLYALATGEGDNDFYGLSQSGTPTVNVSNSAVASSAGTWDATLGTSLLDNGTWDDTDSSNPFLLSHFQADPWDNSAYTSADDNSVGYAAGDPHIRPLVGKSYDFDIMGNFLLFDNNNKNRLIIKGVSEYGDGKHRKLTYIRKLIIKYCEKKLVIDTGFRGKRVTILKNKGFDDINMRELKMGRNIKRICDEKSCRHKTTDDNYTAHNHSDHIIQPLIRNELSLLIDVPNDNRYKVTVRNVNFMNVHPCQIHIVPEDMSKLDNYSGAIVRDESVIDKIIH
jgi:hypothetical protein